MHVSIFHSDCYAISLSDVQLNANVYWICSHTYNEKRTLVFYFRFLSAIEHILLTFFNCAQRLTNSVKRMIGIKPVHRLRFTLLLAACDLLQSVKR